MQSRTKRRLAREELDTLLRRSVGIGCQVEMELTDGWFNTAYRVLMDDGRLAVVKLAPLPDVPVLRYERGILQTEAMVYRRIEDLGGGIPTPSLLYAENEFLAVSVLDGIPWDKAADRLSPTAESALRRELGAITARLHTLTSDDGRYGYPAPESGLSGADWRTAFTAMVDAALEDAERWQSPLEIPPADIRTLVNEGGYALEEVTRPRLVHFDLWPGNIFINDPDDGTRPRITGLIDHERAFWGDPAADLVSLAFGGDSGPGSDLIAGYTDAGGHLDFTPALHHRLALYHLYLGLILVAECGPRGYGPDHLAYWRHMLIEALARLRAFD